jgi:hypothetical protein
MIGEAMFSKKDKHEEIPNRPPERAKTVSEQHNPPVKEDAVEKQSPPTGWHPGPVPNGTFNWGFVVPVGEGGNFYFADFKGDHVELSDGRTLMPDKVAFYNNCLTAPPASPEGAQRSQ